MPVLKTIGLPPAPMWLGVYSAVVYANNDPMGHGRVILLIPQVMGTALSNWADPVSQLLGAPVPGTYVLAAFTGGDINKPVFWIQQSSSTITVDTWHTLGALTHYTIAQGRYRLTADNCVELDINVTGDGAQTTTTSFASTLATTSRPATDHTFLPMGASVNAFSALSVLANGTVSVINTGAAATFATCVRVPLN